MDDPSMNYDSSYNHQHSTQPRTYDMSEYDMPDLDSYLDMTSPREQHTHDVTPSPGSARGYMPQSGAGGSGTPRQQGKAAQPPMSQGDRRMSTPGGAADDGDDKQDGGETGAKKRPRAAGAAAGAGGAGAARKRKKKKDDVPGTTATEAQVLVPPTGYRVIIRRADGFMIDPAPLESATLDGAPVVGVRIMPGDQPFLGDSSGQLLPVQHSGGVWRTLNLAKADQQSGEAGAAGAGQLRPVKRREGGIEIVRGPAWDTHE